MQKWVVVLVSVIACLAGCNVPPSDKDAAVDAQIVSTTADASIQNAIIAQHCVFPYHFVVNTAQLNQLGVQDVRILASYYRLHPGQLSIRRGDASDSLYSARVSAVLTALRQAGVAANEMAVSDSPPGGDGISSDRLIRILHPRQGQDGGSGVVGQAIEAMAGAKSSGAN